MTETRKLPYPLNWQFSNEGAVNGDITAPFTFPTENNTDKAYVTIHLSVNDLVQFASSLDVGRDIAYPECEATQWDNWETIWSNLLTLCEAIISQCFTDEDFQDALTDLLNGLGFGQNGANTGEVIGSIGSENLNLNSDCTDDGTYGVAYELVNQMNTVVEDWLDLISGIADALELAGELIDNVPVIGAFISTAYDVAVFLYEEMVSAYTSAFNTATHDAIACEVWQYMCDDCEITLDELQRAYRQFVPVLNIPDNGAGWLAWAEWFADLAVTTDEEIVAAMHLMILVVWRTGSAWASSSQRQLQIASQQADGLSPPMGCDCDSAWGYEWDFTANNGQTDGWLPTAAGGEYTASVGYTATKPTSKWANYLGMADVGEDITLTGVEFECYVTSGLDTTNNAKIRAWANLDFTNPKEITINSNATGDPVIYTFNGSEAGIESILCSLLGTASGGSDTVIQRIRLYGRGSHPVWTQGEEI